MTEPLPRAARPFVQFATLLRANGFAVAPEQTQAFIAAVGLLGPVTMRDIHRAALPTLAPPPERRDEFDALFRLLFHGQTLAAPSDAEPEDDEDLQILDAGGRRDGAARGDGGTGGGRRGHRGRAADACASSATRTRARRCNGSPGRRRARCRASARIAAARRRAATAGTCAACCATPCAATAR